MNSTIILQCSTTKRLLEHSLEHAQALFDYEKSKGFKNWTIAKGQPYKLKDGIIVKSNKGADTESIKQDIHTDSSSK